MKTVQNDPNASLLEEVNHIEDVITISRKAKRVSWIMEKSSIPKKWLKKLANSGITIGESFRKRNIKRRENSVAPTVPFPIRIVANSAYKTGGK